MECSIKNCLVFGGIVAAFVFILYYNSIPSAIVRACGSSISGTTGILFRMVKVRSFPMNQLSKTPAVNAKNWADGKHCKRWTVTTTIWEPSKTLLQISELTNWCSVVVLDKKTPLPFVVPNAVILTVEMQEKLQYRILRSLPWNHFGRKNIGFLYAIAHGAEVIYDCDDDNELIVTNDQRKSIPLAVGAEVLTTPVGVSVFNPYPSFGNVGGWPRGFPLDQILNRTTYVLPQHTNVASEDNFYVHQSLANNDPDYDAIYRLTRPLPVTFTPNSAISPAAGTFIPYNAQATLYFKNAFWGLLLPITVHGRVSDIWRSYFTQRLLWDIGGRIAFRTPWVIQYRNAHNYLADFDSELDLYRKTTALLPWLREWDSEEKNLKRRWLQLAIDLYEHGIIEVKDVVLLNDWLHDLTSAGYRFPELVVPKV